MPNIEVIRWLETVSFQAMPALWTRQYDGWVLRFANTYTRRANSVNPIYGSQLDLAEKIHQCEALYHDHQQPTIFKLTDACIPTDLEARLADRGYEAGMVTQVQARLLDSLPDMTPVSGSPHLDAEWLNAYRQMNEVPAQHHTTLRAMLTQIHHPTWYALIKDGSGRHIAVGLGVLTGSLLGIFDIVVDARLRGQGIGTQLIHGLLAWGSTHGAHVAYLQVNATNTAGLRLYARLGFQDVYRYWYRTKLG
jgi:GNAT superfamily N-acetyltransferase